ncbi:sulfotransferase family protein [Marinimicrobium locisalis]|uniref:sulfotransferase family protein n=1 Tax=Marinimicrobium locisalis TaxID=546022 RepID=UPI003221B3FD
MLGKMTRKICRWSGRFRNRKRIFLLSHMRANTSLFGHILGSNPDVEGYYELHESYLRPADLKKTQRKYYHSHCPKKAANYLFDKLLHNHHQLARDVMGAGDKLVMMIREPEPTIKSIVKIFSDKPNSQWADQESAERYYVDRLRELARLSAEFRGRYFVLKSEDLISDTDQTLRSLSEFLALETPLSEHYKTFAKTGRRGFGDSSSNITTGKIVKEKPVNEPSVEVDPSCREVYRETLATLYDNASHY